MKNIVLLLCFVFAFGLIVKSQNSVEEYVQKGIEFHDEGKYMKAIEMYKKALDLDPKSPSANYEICYSFLSLKDYENAIKYADKVIAMKNDYSIQGYVIKGTAYDDNGNPKKAVKVYQEGIKRYGHNYLLCYNLAVTYVSLNDYDKAEEWLSYGLKSKPDHPGSNLLLAYLNMDRGRKIPAILGLHYFLITESGTERSVKACKSLLKLYGSIATVGKNESGNMQINISLTSSNLNDEFRTTELIFSMRAALNLTDSTLEKTPQAQFIANTKNLFETLAENAKNDKKGIYWEMYVPFFKKIVESDHFETYCYYIMSRADEVAAQWVEDNKDKISELAEWFQSLN